VHTIALSGIGVFAGFFVVPLFALIQSRTPKTELSRVIAGMNIQNAAFIVLRRGARHRDATLAGLVDPAGVPGAGHRATLVALWIFTIVPEFLMRFLSWLLVRTLYRLRVRAWRNSCPTKAPR
jgi:hypothetical protein